MLIVQTGPLFTADDDAGLPVTLIDALDAGGDALVGEDASWEGIYGPSLVDNVLDLLLDGVTGTLVFASPPSPPGDLAVMITSIAGKSPEVLKPGELQRSPDSLTTVYLPCLQTMLERFVRDRRWMRSRQNCQAVSEVRRVEPTPKPRQKDLALAAWFEEDAFGGEGHRLYLLERLEEARRRAAEAGNCYVASTHLRFADLYRLRLGRLTIEQGEDDQHGLPSIRVTGAIGQ